MARTITIHATGTEAATTQSTTVTLRDHEVGGLFILDITATNGSPTLDVKLQFVDELSGKFVDVPGAAFAQKSSTGTDSLIVFPGVTAAANRAVSYALPQSFRVVYTVGGTGSPSFTFTLTCQTLG